MFFQINVTPKEKKVKVKTVDVIEQNQEEQRFTLVLAPFQPQTRIKLDSTVYTAVRCVLIIRNTGTRNLNVTVTKTAPQERALELSTLELSVEAEKEAELGITWTPQEAGSWRDTLQLTDSRRIKYDVALITSAKGCSKLRGKARTRVLGPSNSNATYNVRPREKPPPTVRQPKKNPSDGSLFQLNVPNKRPRLNIQPNNKENVRKDGWIYEATTQKHFQSHNSTDIHDFSSIIDSTNFNFTPVKVGSSKERLQPETTITEEQNLITFSPQNPKILSPNITEEPKKLRRDTYVTEPKFYKKIVIKEEPQDADEEIFEDSLSPQPAMQQLDLPELSMNCNTPKSEGARDFSPNACSTGNRTKSDASVNSRSSSLNVPTNNTFNVSGHLESSTRANGTYELLPTSPKRSPNTDSLKPTRLSRNFGPMSPVPSEISNEWSRRLAASSPIAMDAMPTHCDFSRRSSITQRKTYDDSSVKDVLEADLWVKSETQYLMTTTTTTTTFCFMGRCNSLEKIVEERYSDETKSDNALNKTTTLTTTEKSKGHISCIEISPPKKINSRNKDSPIRRISPTKGTKIRKERSVLESSANLRKKVQLNCSIKRGNLSIPGVRIANLSLAGLNKSAGVKNKSLRTEASNVSVKLRDPNDIFLSFRNPDLFAATMTQDPFLSNAIYYDEKWINHQEMEFKKWLNALLTPSEHLDADVDTIRVDVGKVWQSCRTKDNVTLAETREAVSARYHTNTRLDTLRKAACAMLRRDEVKLALSKAATCVEKGILMIKQDRDLHRDIGLQKEILELFLSYNPLWLRIGLEIIYGETIPLQSNNDLVGLTRFLLSRFFSDPYIVKNHSHATIPSLKLSTFVTHMNKFILQKFLFIVYFLDYAKRNKLIGHDPCLFHKRADHKDSRSILLAFSRELLSGVGDVTKVLRAHDYVVSHKQTFLDEYDYAVSNIATDLRDGVRLCRVMELITGNRNLTCRCRVPAISRLQKVHNVDIALKALLRCDYNLIGDIDAKSIADGHREKTLSLLWQIIYKYQAPKFEKATRSVQKWWRSILWYVRVRNFLRNRQNNAASTIQRAWKCYKSRRIVQELRDERNRQWAEKEEAVRLIQLRWIQRMRMLRERESFLITRQSVVQIQRWFRIKRDTASDVREFRRKRQAIVTIQQYWRARCLMRKERNTYLKLVDTCIKLQILWRAKRTGREVFERHQKMKHSAVFIQSKWRAQRAMKTDREAFLLKLNSAKIIQSWWRRVAMLKRDRNTYLLKKHSVRLIEIWWISQQLMELEKKTFNEKRKSAIIVQRNWRKYLQTRDDVMRFKQVSKAAKTIQLWWKAARVAKQYNRTKRSCLIVQRSWRALLLMKSERTAFLSLRKAAIMMQKTWRMKRARRNYLRTKNAVETIQSWYRNCKIGRTARQEFERRRNASLVIQTWWRNWNVTREHCNQYLEYRKSVVFIQRQWRANHIAKRTRFNYLAMKKAATKIQARWRMVKKRRNYVKKLRAAVTIEKRWRETLMARKVRNNYVAYRSACILIQNRYRELRTARTTRKVFLLKRKAAIMIQKNWRMLEERRNYLKKRGAVLTIQRRWRETVIARKVRNNYVAYRSACILIQNRYREFRIARTTRHDYLLKRRAAILIQKNWRMMVALREYKKQKAAAITLQSAWRCRKLCISMRTKYLVLKNTTITVQRRYRAKKIGLQVRQDYLQLRSNVLLVQRQWHANKSMKEARARFLENRNAAVILQSQWRMILEIRKYRLIGKSVLTIQAKWRAFVAARKARTTYMCLRTHVIAMQQRYRNNRCCKIARQEYTTIRAKIIAIQRLWRIKLENRMREEAAINIQTWWRSIIAMRKCRRSYECQRSAIVVIQRRYRAYKIGKAARELYLCIVSSAVKIQRRWRYVVQRKRYEEWLKDCKEAVLIIEKWWLVILENRRIKRSAIKIQALWRGYKIRKNESDFMKALRERSEKATKAAVPSATIACQLKSSMEMLLVADTIGHLSLCLTAIDTYTRLSVQGSITFCKLNLVDKVYWTLAKANRSLPWLDVCQRSASILITLAKLPDTRKYVYRFEHIETIARLMTITVENHVDLFLHLATLLWLLAEDPEYVEGITRCHRSTWLLSSLYTSINKKKNKATLNKSLVALNKSRVKETTAPLPNSKPDWSLQNKRPRLFTTVHHAITTLIKRLKIDVSKSRINVTIS